MTRRERLLIRKLRERDEKAFREVLETYQDKVFNLTYRMLGNREEAEDVAQEVFITVFKSIDSFRGDAKLSTWLYRVTANHCKNRIKYLARRHDRDRSQYDEAIDRDAAAGAVTNPSQAPRPDRALEGVQRDLLVQRAISELDEDWRLVIVMRDIEDFSYEEICEVTELPLGTVKSRLHRARQALKEKLQRHM